MTKKCTKLTNHRLEDFSTSMLLLDEAITYFETYCMSDLGLCSNLKTNCQIFFKNHIFENKTNPHRIAICLVQNRDISSTRNRR